MRKVKFFGTAAALSLGMVAVSLPSGVAQATASSVGANIIATGMASFYGKKFHGKRTASGEIFNSTAMTAAHRTLRFGTKLRVTNLANGRDVVVRVNDRGPFHKARVIDISRAAAQQIGMVQSGTARVRLELVN